MRIFLGILLLVLVPPSALAGVLVESRPYVLVPFDSLDGGGRYVHREEYERARNDRTLELRRVLYVSDGQRVSALVASPHARSKERLPVVVFNRGGYVVGDVGWRYAPLFHHFVQAGFVVIAPMLRGSDGAEGHDELGGADLADLFNAVPLAAELGIADTSRVFLAGESRGGAMTYMALRRGFPARAAAVWGAFTDLDSLMESDPGTYSKLGPVVWPGWPTRRQEITDARSAARWPAEIRTPLLILHGGADDGVRLSHPVRLVEGLERAGRDYRFLVLGGQRHTLRDATDERDARIVEWFRDHDVTPAR